MLSIDVPGFGDLRLAHLVLDYNGTLACDGTLVAGVAPLLRELAASLDVHVITADAFGRAAAALAGLPLRLRILGNVDQAEAKLDFVRELGTASVAAIGNGRNDCRMLAAVAVGIAVVQQEGAAQAAVSAADILAPSIVDALELLRYPLRLTATLRA